MNSKVASSRIAPPRRILILRGLALGDLLCAVPALRAFRRAWPAAQITLLGLPWAREFATRFSDYIDRFAEFPGWPGLPERQPLLERIPEFLHDMQGQQFDLAVQLHGSGTIVNSLVALLNARQTAGFFPRGYYCPDASTFAPWPESGLEIHRLLSLVDFLGLPRCGDQLELPIADADYRRLTKAVAPASLMKGRYVVIHPGASVEARRWPAKRFAAVADELAAHGYAIVLTGVTSERPIVRRVVSAMQHAAIDLSGRTDLGALGALVQQAALVVCNDTGVSHVAAAVRTPSVVISTGDNPQRWAPINRSLHRVVCREQGVEVKDVVNSASDVMESLGDGSRSAIVPRRALVTA